MSRGHSVILHVVAGGAPCPEWVSKALSATSNSVEIRKDVYRAMARIGRSISSESNGRAPLEPVAAVLVGVDRLGTREFEFFQLAARMHPALRIWAYGNPESRAKIDLALRLGGQAECTPENIDLRLREVEIPIENLTDKRESSDPILGRSIGAGASIKRIKGDGRFPESEPPNPPVDSPSGNVPVPWSRKPAAPARRPPRREPGSPVEIKPTDASPAKKRTEPLLTDAELAALIGKPTPISKPRRSKPRP